jgi:2-phosphoglycerate kinase
MRKMPRNLVKRISDLELLTNEPTHLNSTQIRENVLKEQQPPKWKVLLIGGSSAVGKTVITRALARYFQVSILLVDDIRLALQQITSPSQHPDLHVFLPDKPAAQDSPEQICNDWITVGNAISPAIKMVIAHHTVVSGVGPIIIEGDGILPMLASQRDFSELKFFWSLKTTHEVRSVILDEPDEKVILKNMQVRGRGFNELSLEEQQKWTNASCLYGQWLRQEATIHEVPVLAARPYDTLLERILTVLA